MLGEELNLFELYYKKFQNARRKPKAKFKLFKNALAALLPKGYNSDRRNCSVCRADGRGKKYGKAKEGSKRMNIIKNQNGNSLNIVLEGRLDTTTSPQLEAELRTALNQVEELVFDFGKLDYISSAGLRVLLSAQKTMNKQGKMTIRNVKPEIMEIFEVTGFVDILTIEG